MPTQSTNLLATLTHHAGNLTITEVTQSQSRQRLHGYLDALRAVLAHTSALARCEHEGLLGMKTDDQEREVGGVPATSEFALQSAIRAMTVADIVDPEVRGALEEHAQFLKDLLAGTAKIAQRATAQVAPPAVPTRISAARRTAAS